MQDRSIRRTLCVVLLLCVLALGAGSGSMASGNVLIVAQGGDVTTLDPQLQGNMVTMNVVINIFDTLVTRDANMELAPGLATSWKVVNPTTWEFSLRRGVKFHNGEPFNAGSVKFSIDRLLDPKTNSPIVELKTVSRVDIIDDYTVRIITSVPDPLLPAKMVLFGGCIVPKDYITKNGDAQFARQPIGTGPYQLVKWIRDDRVVLKANPSYWKGKPAYESLEFRSVPNANDRVAALLTGEADIIANVPVDMVPRVEADRDCGVLSVPGLRVFYVGLDTRTGPTADKRVRQAMNMAVDIPAIIKNILGGHALQIATPVGQGMFGFDPSIKPYAHDLEKAKKLLADAGYPNGFSIDFAHPSGIYMKDYEVAMAIAGQLAKVGIKMNPVTYEWGVFLDKYRLDQLPASLFMGNFAWTMDADNSVNFLFRTGQMYSRYSNKRVDELIDLESTTLDSAKRKAAFSEMVRILHDDAPWIFLYQANELYGVRSGIEWEPLMSQVMWMHGARPSKGGK